MIRNFLRLLTLTVLLTNCNNPANYSIDFCENLTEDIECNPSEVVFNKGSRIYVLFESDQPFKEKAITGKFYYIENNRMIELGSQDWQINKGDSYAYDYVDFTEPGVYQFEFQTKNGELLASKTITIK